MRLNRFGIGVRLGIAFSIVGLLLAALMATALRSFATLDTTGERNGHTYEVIGAADAMLLGATEMQRGVRGWFLTGDESMLAPLRTGKKRFADAYSRARSLTVDNADQQRRLVDVQSAFAQVEKAAGTLEALRRDAGAEFMTGARMQEAFTTHADRKGIHALFEQLDGFRNAELDLLVQRKAAADQAQSTARMLVCGLGATAMALAALLAWAITRSITQPMSRAIEAATRVADGDLARTVQSEGDDEVAKLLGSLEAMRERLHGIVTGIRSATESVSTASTQIAQGNLDLSSRTEQQAASLQETASAMEQLSSTVAQNAQAATRASEMAVAASTSAGEGTSRVDEVVATMQAISASSRKIADIVGLIDGIAFQTNILALNAAVEAARAGEQGRGFAVVAGEVRTLAQRSAEAAREIKALIHDSTRKVDDGGRLVTQAGDAMRGIVAHAQRVSDIVGEIRVASTEQSGGIQGVNQAVQQLDTVTQQNAALVEESSAAAQSLSDSARELAQAVAVFRT